MIIVEAIKEVMRIKGQPMTAKEAYQQIVKNNFYEFKAADPVHIVNGQIRKHCKGISEQKSYSRTKHFISTEGNRYYFLEPPERIQNNKGKTQRKYYLPKIDSVKLVSLQDIAGGDLEYQVRALKEWFLSEYKPASSVEGNSVSVLDGPYEALDVLSNEFSDILSSTIILKIAKEIEDNFSCKEWSKIPKDDDIDEYFIENLNTEFYKNFEAAVKSIEKLSKQSPNLKDELEQALNRMLYGHIITAMESYLSDAFITTVLSNEESVRTLVEKAPELRARTLNLGEIFLRFDSLKDEVQIYLMDLVYHRLDKVRELYYHTLSIDFPKNLSIIFKAILNRHDIVHRNGKRKDGSALNITSNDIDLLLKEVTAFIREVDKQLR
ncbi:MAG: winged helix-turn-helix domain-containing protein [Lyngbya sp. HA4199-MV5]|jgi:hypothetical protein|nr:winged helix-turn-helix domain-containing protein [Lyngbya sp. HA4199-MV5]